VKTWAAVPIFCKSGASPPAEHASRAVDAERICHEGEHSYTGLANLAFLHEQPGWGGYDNPPYEAVIFNLDAARAHLVDAAEQAEARRRNPLYWIDRALRALLTIPAYLVGLIVGESAVKIDRSAWGLPLRGAMRAHHRRVDHRHVEVHRVQRALRCGHEVDHRSTLVIPAVLQVGDVGGLEVVHGLDQLSPRLG
jgi:hypothetical protein